ncbi:MULTISPECIES: NAD-dependent epimerase/dehydratase family protein [Streptomyces]|uniref:NAD-dependent epimerase/dehydratase family protein n=1 Tax=Streptomyces parvus TaxID=66428 RepID=A0A5D4JG30_9ACTN|nr:MULTISPECIES: NAD-dependent epimerase/dehydratase family protein [Streptomyces]PVC95892.1 hypothetical protein DBP12_17215 [Streptomyces sp. CS014]TYR64451.1 NAD-dependent epimerase/dehydratase family protein [Streptomyces parvus]
MSRSAPAARVLVLGSSGFVGRHVCAAFLARGWEVHGWTRSGREEPGVITRAVDLVRVEPARLAAELAAVASDTVVNAAGAVWGVDEAEMAASNETAVSRVLAALGVPGAHFVQLGSVHEHRAATAYGRTKAAASARVLAAGGTVLRLPNLLGPGTPEGSFLGRVGAQLAHAARTGEEVTVTALALRERREFLDVRDAAEAVVAAAHPATAGTLRGRSLDLATGRPVEVRHLLDLLIRISGVPARVAERLPAPGEAPPGGLAGVEGGPAGPVEAARLLGWHAVREPRESLRGLWEAATSTGPLATG